VTNDNDECRITEHVYGGLVHVDNL